MDNYAPPYVFDEHSHLKNTSLHFGVCGSIAAFRALDLLRWWNASNLHVSVTLSESAQKFVTPLSFEALGAASVYTGMWEKDSVFGHLEPGQICKAMVIAPATASTISHITYGNADSLLACQALAFDGPLVIAPAMNPRMWNNAATQENIAKLKSRNVTIIVPDSGGTACGDEGQGRLADLRYIWLAALKAVTPQDMSGIKIMLTLGPTREKWDAVRYWSNPSTGSMGAALAVSAWLRGAEVHAICGPVSEKHCYLPPDIKRYDVLSAKAMYAVAADVWQSMDMGIFTAAVADFSPQNPKGSTSEKFKKHNSADGFSIDFTPNIDILHTLCKDKKPNQKAMGFAAETTVDMLEAVRKKLNHKGADVLVGNNIAQAGSGFASPTNEVVVADRFGREEAWPILPKMTVAWRLCSWLLDI